MKCLVVIAHPLAESLCHTLAATAIAALTDGGHEVNVEDLCASGFAPALTAAERRSYYGEGFDATAVRPQVERLLAAEGIVLCFPTWWFGFPAVLKGWFDRVWAPGIAYDHAGDLGAIEPRLSGLRRLLAVTTLGAPWWADRLLMRQPVKRVLGTAIVGSCAPACRVDMLSLYRAERLDAAQVARYSTKVAKALADWK